MHYLPYMKNPPPQFPKEEPVSEAGRRSRVWLNQLTLWVYPAEAVRVSAPLGGQLLPHLRTGSLGFSPLPAPYVEAGG